MPVAFGHKRHLVRERRGEIVGHHARHELAPRENGDPAHRAALPRERPPGGIDPHGVVIRAAQPPVAVGGNAFERRRQRRAVRSVHHTPAVGDVRL